MIFIKVTLILGIILICNSLGVIKSKSFSNRYEALKKFKQGLGVFKTKLEFTYEPICEIFEDISKLVYENQNNVFKSFITTNDWEASVEDAPYLEKEDKEVMKSLGKMLGKLDKDGQLNEIYLVDNFIDKQIEISLEAKRKNEKLYKTLGKVVGIAIAIILI